MTIFSFVREWKSEKTGLSHMALDINCKNNKMPQAQRH